MIAFTDVPCPVCGAAIGEGCATKYKTRPLKHQHDARIDASLAPFRKKCVRCGLQFGKHGAASPHDRGAECEGFQSTNEPQP